MSRSVRRILLGLGGVLVSAAAAGAVVFLRQEPTRPGMLAAAQRSLAAMPLVRERGALAPWRVGIQAGHWKIEELPDELRRLRGDTGAQWGRLTEAQVNLAIAERVAGQLREAGVSVDLLPATIPVSYDADALVAIHADDGGGSNERGWKIAAPWRSSAASRSLRDFLARAYGGVIDIPEDRYGVSFNMRGYYAFSWTRFEHAVAPSTPAAIIETGFLTSAADRQIIVDDPERVARAISLGVLAYLGELAHMPPAARMPVVYPPMVVASDLAPLRFFPGDTERILARVPAGTRVRAMDEENGWVDLVVAGHFREFGWMKATDLGTPEGG